MLKSCSDKTGITPGNNQPNSVKDHPIRNSCILELPDQKSDSMGRQKSILNRRYAREIFQLKLVHGCASLHGASIDLARKYGVSPKAIRDIWKGRSWLDATYDLWEDADRPQRKIMGRPKGRKDDKPRVRGVAKQMAGQKLTTPPSNQTKSLHEKYRFSNTSPSDRVWVSSSLYRQAISSAVHLRQLFQPSTEIPLPSQRFSTPGLPSICQILNAIHQNNYPQPSNLFPPLLPIPLQLVHRFGHINNNFL